MNDRDGCIPSNAAGWLPTRLTETVRRGDSVVLTLGGATETIEADVAMAIRGSRSIFDGYSSAG